MKNKVELLLDTYIETVASPGFLFGGGLGTLQFANTPASIAMTLGLMMTGLGWQGYRELNKETGD